MPFFHYVAEALVIAAVEHEHDDSNADKYVRHHIDGVIRRGVQQRRACGKPLDDVARFEKDYPCQNMHYKAHNSYRSGAHYHACLFAQHILKSSGEGDGGESEDVVEDKLDGRQKP